MNVELDRTRCCTVLDLGLVDYIHAHHLQTRISGRLAAGAGNDVLLLLEHTPTITVGKSGSADNILASRGHLSKMGIQIVFVDRGGDVTFHGPGQLVAYPILDLRSRRRDLHRFVSDLEETAIRTAGDFGVLATRDTGHRGVWVGDDQIGAVGLRVKRWVSTHGVSLNVDMDLAPFSLINPCGFPQGRVTSISALSSQHVSVNAAKERFLAHFGEVLDVPLEREVHTCLWSDANDREIAGLVCAAGG